MNSYTIVTSALPYANGPIHLGHLLEVIQTDIWCRFLRKTGENCFYVCADDAHGTPVMLSAQKEGKKPEDYIEAIRQQHLDDFNAFGALFDSYHSTHSSENKALTEEIYLALKAKNYILEKEIEQLFDPKVKMFLPDRFVKGACPRCKAPDQYGDSCEACGATYSPTELADPKSVLSDATPILKNTTHYFFDLPQLSDWLKSWLDKANLQSSVKAKLQEWFDAGLKAWDISRDEPYFGFKIPGTDDKYFYVWLDAPIGYLASLKKLCTEKNIDFQSLVKADSPNRLIHFIGKDVVYFHTLFWPAMLYGSDLKTPDQVAVHGFVTVNGTKMSKSKGTFIKASDFKDVVEPEYLRYYFASRLNDEVVDIDFEMDSFAQKINSDIVGKLVNLASRSAKMIQNQFSNLLSADLNEAWLAQFTDVKDELKEHYQNRQFAQVVREIMRLADIANQYIDQHKPWVAIKETSKRDEVHQTLSTTLNAFKILVSFLEPIMPKLAEKSAEFLASSLGDWDDTVHLLKSHTIGTFNPLATRIDAEKINAALNQKNPSPQKEKQENMDKKNISMDDFSKIELKIGTILSAEAIPEADKLLRLSVDLGEEKPRQIFAGIKSAYEAASLTGKQVVVVANLAPREMRFGVSEGMVIAAGPGGKDIWLVSPDAGAKAGMRVK